MRSSICAILACAVSTLVFAPMAASENRFVKMEVLAVKEVAVCPGGYGSGKCDGNVLEKLDGLRRLNNSQTYKLRIHPQDDFKAEELELTESMIYILVPPRLREVPLSRRYAGLLVLHLGGEFESVTVPKCRDIEASSQNLSSASAWPSGEYKVYDVPDHDRWYYHCKGKNFLPYGAYEWSIRLDDSIVVFKFVQERDREGES